MKNHNGEQIQGTIQTDSNEKTSSQKRIDVNKMAPKPALYDSARAAVDSEQSILEASEAGGVKQIIDLKLATMNREDEDEEDFDEASDVYSDYTGDDYTEGGESEASSSRRSKSGRRSKHRGSSRRRKHRNKSRSISCGDHYDSEYDDASDAGSHRSPSRRPEGAEGEVPASVPTQSRPSVTAKSSMGNPQPYVKLLNFQTLYRTEQDRCPLFTEELEKVTEHWSVCKEILNRLTDEVRHANHLFHVSDVSFHQYSHVMYTIHKDIFLDDQGKRVLSSARQQLLLKQRGVSNLEGQEEKNSYMDDSFRFNSGGFLDPLYNSFSVLTDTMMKAVLERESDGGKQAAALEFLEFSEELLTQAQEMEALGNSVVQEMEGSEMDIQNSFRKSVLLMLQVRRMGAVYDWWRFIGINILVDTTSSNIFVFSYHRCP